MSSSAEEIAILIKAQNQTQQAFEAARKEVQGLSGEASRANASLKSMWSTLGSAAGAAGLSLSVGAVLSFGKSVLDTASQIGDLSDQLGISVEAVQGFKFAAEQSGSTLDAVGTAITKMNQKLGAGDASTVSALKSLGLQFDQVRAMSPENAFLAITDALKGVSDPMLQTRLELELFGKSGAELLPAIKAGFRDVADSASKMSTETIKSLKAAQDAWNELGTRVTIVTGNMIAGTMNATANITSSWKGFGLFVSNVMKFGIAGATAMADLAEASQQAAKTIPDIVLPIAKTTDATTKAIPKVKEFKEVLASMPPVIAGITSNLDRLGTVVEDFNDGAHRTAAELMGWNQMDAAAEMINAVNIAMSRGVDISKMSTSAQDEINRSVSAGIDAYTRLGLVAPQALRDLYAATIKLPPVVGGIFGSIGKELPMPQIPSAPKTALHSIFGSASQFGGDVGNVLLKALTGGGNAVQSAGALIGTKLTTSLAAKLTTGLAPMLSGVLGGAANAILPGLGALVGPLAEKFVGLFDRNKGRDLVKDFAGSLGGFDALHTKLLTLGDQGEQLWVKLTQGVGKNNPSQAKTAIDLVTKALDAQKNKEDEVAEAAKQSAAVQDAAITKIKDAIKGIDDQISSLQDSIAGEAPEEFMGVVERETRDRIAALAQQRQELETQLQEQQADTNAAVQDVGSSVDTVTDSAEATLGIFERWKHAIDGAGDSLAGLRFPDGSGPAMPEASHASGAYIEQDHVAHVHAGEIIGPIDFMRRALRGAIGSGGGDGTIVVHSHVHIDGREVALANARHQRQVLAPYGVR